MKLFGQLVRTAVNVAKLPVTLPVAMIRDGIETMAECEGTAEKTKAVLKELKDDAKEN